MSIEVRGSGRRQDNLPTAQREVRRMRSRDIVRHRRRHDASVGVRTDRVIEHRLASGKTAFSQAVLGDRVHGHDGCRLSRNRHVSRFKRRRRGPLAPIVAFTCAVRRRHAHLHQLQVGRLVAVEVHRTGSRQYNLPRVQCKI